MRNLPELFISLLPLLLKAMIHSKNDHVIVSCTNIHELYTAVSVIFQLIPWPHNCSLSNGIFVVAFEVYHLQETIQYTRHKAQMIDHSSTTGISTFLWIHALQIQQLNSVQLLGGDLGEQLGQLQGMLNNGTGQLNLGQLLCGRDRAIFNIGSDTEEQLQNQADDRTQGRLESYSGSDQLNGLCM